MWFSIGLKEYYLKPYRLNWCYLFFRAIGERNYLCMFSYCKLICFDAVLEMRFMDSGGIQLGVLISILLKSLYISRCFKLMISTLLCPL